MSPHAVSIVEWLMRSLIPMLLFLGACTRPVLYYPSPRPVPQDHSVAAATTPVAMNDGTASPSADAPPRVEMAAAPATSMTAAEMLRERSIIVPVAAESLTKIENSFDAPRDNGGRVHHAVDIMAPRGTPILSADDGFILRMNTSELGGICLYAADAESRFVYYYAHMDAYQEGLAVGHKISKGDTLGFVGTTGNAPKDVPHLHFQVMLMPRDGRFWQGEPINPFDALKVGTKPK